MVKSERQESEQWWASEPEACACREEIRPKLQFVEREHQRCVVHNGDGSDPPDLLSFGGTWEVRWSELLAERLSPGGVGAEAVGSEVRTTSDERV